MDWRKSTYSEGNGGSCIETASGDGVILVGTLRTATADTGVQRQGIAGVPSPLLLVPAAEAGQPRGIAVGDSRDRGVTLFTLPVSAPSEFTGGIKQPKRDSLRRRECPLNFSVPISRRYTTMPLI